MGALSEMHKKTNTTFSFHQRIISVTQLQLEFYYEVRHKYCSRPDTLHIKHVWLCLDIVRAYMNIGYYQSTRVLGCPCIVHLIFPLYNSWICLAWLVKYVCIFYGWVNCYWSI